MRTTLDIDAHLLKRLRADAERQGISFKDAVAGALRRGLDTRSGRAAASGRFRMPTHSMGEPLAGVNMTKALAHAAELEDEEIARKLLQRK
jgi:hypothetical protein